MAWGSVMSTVPNADPDAGHGELPREAVFDILSNRRRRYVLRCLRDRDDPVSIRELSETIASWENDCDVPAVEPKQRKRVYTALHQTHLPKMVQAGVAVYDSDRGLVELTPLADDLEAYLDLDTDGDEESGDRLTLAVAVAAGIVGIGLALGFSALSVLPPWGYLVAFSAVILLGWGVESAGPAVLSDDAPRQPLGRTDAGAGDD